MVKDQQVRRLFKLIQTEKHFGTAAIKTGMDEKTARKYRRLGKLPSELEQPQYLRSKISLFHHPRTHATHISISKNTS